MSTAPEAQPQTELEKEMSAKVVAQFSKGKGGDPIAAGVNTDIVDICYDAQKRIAGILHHTTHRVRAVGGKPPITDMIEELEEFDVIREKVKAYLLKIALSAK